MQTRSPSAVKRAREDAQTRRNVRMTLRSKMDLFDRDLFFQIDAARINQARLVLFLFPRILALGNVAESLRDRQLAGSRRFGRRACSYSMRSMRPYSKKTGYLLPFSLIRGGAGSPPPLMLCVPKAAEVYRVTASSWALVPGINRRIAPIGMPRTLRGILNNSAPPLSGPAVTGERKSFSQ
jgi:hypothetical protein